MLHRRVGMKEGEGAAWHSDAHTLPVGFETPHRLARFFRNPVLVFLVLVMRTTVSCVGRIRMPQLPQLPLLLLMFLLSLLVLLSDHGQQVDARPMPSSDQVRLEMQNTPQWHCLRYRKLDLINHFKRCRVYRISRKQ